MHDSKVLDNCQNIFKYHKRMRDYVLMFQSVEIVLRGDVTIRKDTFYRESDTFLHHDIDRESH